MIRQTISILLASFTFISCTNKSEYKSIDSNEDKSAVDTYNYDRAYDAECVTSEIVLYDCPMCGTIGQIRHYNTEEIMECPACNGSGRVTKEILNQLIEAEKIGNEIAGDGSISGEGDNLYNDIPSEIAQCEHEIESLQNGLSQLDEGSTLYLYYSQELIRLQYRLRELQLRN